MTSSSSTSSEAIASKAKKAFNVASRRVPSGEEGDAARRRLLLRIRQLLEAAEGEVKAANEADVRKAQEAGLSTSLISRLDLFAKKGKWQAMLDGIDQVAHLPSPLDRCTYAKRLADEYSRGGPLDLYRVTCPIGVLLCIFEARPEVIVNIASLSIKSGNAAILKGGKESAQSAAVLSRVLRQALADDEYLPPDLIQTVETREDVNALLQLDEYIDLVIPRGSNQLVRSIQRASSIPVMGHADGLCSAYIHQDAEAASTVANLVDAKIDYPAACNAVETILVHSAHLRSGLLAEVVEALLAERVTVRMDERSLTATSTVVGESEYIRPAELADYDTEFLSLDVAVKVVDSLDEAIEHINEHGSHHTDVIFTRGDAAAAFVRAVDSANVYVNASTRFADGFRYGFGTEVGISTGKMHARGPVGLEGLVTYKYVGQGHGGRQACADFGNGRTFSHSDLDLVYPDV